MGLHGQWAVQLLNIYLLPISCRPDKLLGTAATFSDSAVWAAFIRSGLFARKPLPEVTGEGWCMVITYHLEGCRRGVASRLGDGRGQGLKGQAFVLLDLIS